jgi:hypothetical protein
MQSQLQQAGQYLQYLDSQFASDAGTLGKQLIDSQDKLQQTVSRINDSMNTDISAAILNQMVKLGKISSTGDMDTPEATLRAQTDVLNDLNNNIIPSLSEKYTNAMKETNDYMKTSIDANNTLLNNTQESSTFDNDASKLTGVMTNKFGQPILGSDGKPQTFDNTDVGEILSKNGPENGPDSNGNLVP